MTEEQKEEQEQPREYNLARKRICDSREPWPIVSELIKTGWERSQLYSGDYFFFSTDYKKIGIERKEVGDLISSIGERLSKQLQDMLDYYDFSILLIEGNIKYADGKMITSRGFVRMMIEGYRNFVRTWQDRGVTIERTSSHSDTIIRLNELYTYYQKPVHTGGITKKQVGDPRLLAFPPTIGIKTGKVILEKLGSLHAVANADLETLKNIPGIGAKRAEAILLYYRKDGRAEDERIATESQAPLV